VTTLAAALGATDPDKATFDTHAADTVYFTKQPKSLERLRLHWGFQIEAFEGLDHALLNGEPRRLAGKTVLAPLEPGAYSRRAGQ
jgi:hypothetical protein